VVAIRLRKMRLVRGENEFNQLVSALNKSSSRN